MCATPLLAQGGFNRTAVSFGEGDRLSSDMVMADVNFDDEMDAIVACSDGDNDHVIYWSIASEEPDEPTEFATSRGHSLLVADTYSWFGVNDIIIADEEGLRLYLNDGYGVYTEADEYEITGHGAPVFIQSGLFADSVIKGVVVGYADCVVCFPVVDEEFSASPYYVMEYAEGVTSVHAMDIVPGDYLELLVLADGIVYVYELGEEEADLYGWAPFEGALYIAPGNEAGTLLAVATASDLLIYEWDPDPTEVFILVNESELSFARHVRQIVAAELTGDSYCDFVIMAAGMTYILKQKQEGYELYEFVGYIDAEMDVRVRVADVDDDTYPDILVARAESPHQAYLNRDRLELTIDDAEEVEWTGDGQAYAEFPWELDAEPVSLVLLRVEVGDLEEIEEESGGDEDALPDFGEVERLLKGQLSTKPVIISVLASTGGVLFIPVPAPPPAPPPVLGWHLSISASPFGSVMISAPGTAVITPLPTQGWTLDGQINAMARDSAERIFVGGDFTGMTWEVEGEVASMDTGGRRRTRIPPANISGQMDVRRLVADANGYVYVTGQFSFSINNVLIRNVARIMPTGQWDLSFRPNPVGPSGVFGRPVVALNEMAFAGGKFHTTVYLGGHFTTLQDQSDDPGKNRLARKFARVPAWDQDGYFTGTGTVDSLNDIRVTGEPDPNEPLKDPGQATYWGAISALAFLDTPEGGRLAIGGGDCNSIRFGKPYSVGRDMRGIRNLAIVALSGTGTATYPRHIPQTMARVFDSSSGSFPNTASVTELKFARDTNMTFNDSQDPIPALALVFSGRFSHLAFKQDPTTYACDNICVTTLRGHFPNLQALLTGGPEVHSFAVDDMNRVWAANWVTTVTTGSDALAVYRINNFGGPGRLLTEPFDVGPNGPVSQVAFDPVEQVVIAVGDFTSRPASRNYTGTTPPTTFQTTIPANRITAYSTTKAPDGAAWTGYGDHVPKFRGSLAASSQDAVRLRVGAMTGGAGGYWVMRGGGGFPNPSLPWSMKLDCANIAAIDWGFRILDWGPRTTGPVNAILVDTSSLPEVVYYGGACHSFGLPHGTSVESYVMACEAVMNVPAKSWWPADWWVEVIDSVNQPSLATVDALGLGEYLYVGGKFTDVNSSAGLVSRESAAAVDPYALTPVGMADPAGWNPILFHNTNPFVHVNAIQMDGFSGVFLGGDFDGSASVTPSATRYGVGRFHPITGELDTGFDAGLDPGNIVYGLAMDSSANLYISGALGSLSPGQRVATVWDGTSLAYDIIARNSASIAVGRAVTLADDHLIIGGDFAEVWTGSAWATRKGVSAFTASSGVVNQSWAPNPVASPPGDRINALLAQDAAWKLWMGGHQPSASSSGFMGRSHYP